MKLRKSGQILLATVVSLGVGLGLTSCSPSNTIDYVYITNTKANPGQINVYYADSLSGALTQIPDSPYQSGGRNPVGEVTSPNAKNLYVINRDDNNIVQFAIGSDGKLYPLNTYNTPGSEPNAIAINQAGTLLFVADFYQPVSTGAAPYSPTNPGPGDLVVYTINSDGSLGGPVTQTFTQNGTQVSAPYYPLGVGPSGVSALANNGFVYVSDTLAVNGAGCSVGQGGIDGLQVSSAGVLTPAPGTPYCAGTTPSAIASDPTSRFLYVTDSRQNQLIGYTILSTGQLVTFPSGPSNTDVFPDGIVVDPRGQYIYVSNYTSNDVSAYAINQQTGSPSALAGAATYGTGTGPICVIVEPGLARFVYTANFLDNTVTGFQLNPNTGTLILNQNSPYLAAGQPTCAAAVPHGNHAFEHVQSAPGT